MSTVSLSKETRSAPHKMCGLQNVCHDLAHVVEEARFEQVERFELLSRLCGGFDLIQVSFEAIPLSQQLRVKNLNLLGRFQVRERFLELKPSWLNLLRELIMKRCTLLLQISLSVSEFPKHLVELFLVSMCTLGQLRDAIVGLTEGQGVNMIIDISVVVISTESADVFVRFCDMLRCCLRLELESIQIGLILSDQFATLRGENFHFRESTEPTSWLRSSAADSAHQHQMQCREQLKRLSEQ